MIFNDDLRRFVEKNGSSDMCKKVVIDLGERMIKAAPISKKPSLLERIKEELHCALSKIMPSRFKCQRRRYLPGANWTYQNRR